MTKINLTWYDTTHVICGTDITNSGLRVKIRAQYSERVLTCKIIFTNGSDIEKALSPGDYMIDVKGCSKIIFDGNRNDINLEYKFIPIDNCVPLLCY